MTAIRSARRSASSRYCVVSSTVVPSETSASIASQSPIRLRMSSPVVGSSRNRTGGRATSAAARSRRRRIPPEYVRTRRSPASDRSNEARSSRARSRECRAPEVVEAADHLQVLEAGQVLVDGRVLAREPDVLANLPPRRGRRRSPRRAPSPRRGRAAWSGSARRSSCRRRSGRAGRRRCPSRRADRRREAPGRRRSSCAGRWSRRLDRPARFYASGRP